MALGLVSSLRSPHVHLIQQYHHTGIMTLGYPLNTFMSPALLTKPTREQKGTHYLCGNQYISHLPQYNVNLVQLVKYEEIHVFTIFVPQVATPYMLGLKIVKIFCTFL